MLYNNSHDDFLGDMLENKVGEREEKMTLIFCRFLESKKDSQNLLSFLREGKS